jgi:ABC-type transporter Mla subunit MlaD
MSRTVRNPVNRSIIDKLSQLERRPTGGTSGAAVISVASVTKQLAEKTDELEQFKEDMTDAYNKLKASFDAAIAAVNDDLSNKTDDLTNTAPDL